jgi:hypothetical protein
MSEQTMSPPAAAVRQQGPEDVPVPTAVASSQASQGVRGEEATEAAGTATRTARRTPARPVLSIALVMFVPAVVLVLDGNLSVQTALVRFAAALLVSWAAARLVWATVRSGAPGAEPAAGDGAGAAVGPERTGSRGTAAPERAA